VSSLILPLTNVQTDVLCINFVTLIAVVLLIVYNVCELSDLLVSKEILPEVVSKAKALYTRCLLKIHNEPC